MLPTGKMLFWSYPFTPSPEMDRNEGRAALWDPSKGTGPAAFKTVTPPLIDVDADGTLEPAPIFCSGQSFLPNGALLVAGGTMRWPEGPNQFLGSNIMHTFDPWSEQWITQPRVRRGRWYPSQVLLADGRTALLGGSTETPPGQSEGNTDLEIFTAPTSPSGVGSVAHFPSGDRFVDQYPHLFTLPNGNVLLAGPDRDDSAILTTAGFTWTNLGSASRHRIRGSAVLRPGGTNGSSVVTQIGGYDDGGDSAAVASTETIDAGAAGANWQPDSPLNVARANQNTVLLPDGSMVTVGGGSGSTPLYGDFETYADGRARQVELYDPVTNRWTLGPAQQEDRTYHSTALLLPDGRVVSAGDDFHPDATPPQENRSSSDTAEIYSPPYLFRKGKRPRIRQAPKRVPWNDKFGIRVGSKIKVKRAVLVAPGATTHAADMHQRHLELRVLRRVKGVGINVKAPPTAAVAPPGYYMLFVINRKGEPSVARWLQLGTGSAKATKLIRKRDADTSKKKKKKKKKKN